MGKFSSAGTSFSGLEDSIKDARLHPALADVTRTYQGIANLRPSYSCKSGQTKPLSVRKRDEMKGIDHEEMERQRGGRSEKNRRQKVRLDVLCLDRAGKEPPSTDCFPESPEKPDSGSKANHAGKDTKAPYVIDLTEEDVEEQKSTSNRRSKGPISQERLTATLQEKLEKLNETREGPKETRRHHRASSKARGDQAADRDVIRIPTLIQDHSEEHTPCGEQDLRQRLRDVEELYGTKFASQADLEEFMEILKEQWVHGSSTPTSTSPKDISEHTDLEESSSSHKNQDMDLGMQLQEEVKTAEDIRDLQQKMQEDETVQPAPSSEMVDVDMDAGEGSGPPSLNTEGY